jgi:hypothetical protein
VNPANPWLSLGPTSRARFSAGLVPSLSLSRSHGAVITICGDDLAEFAAKLLEALELSKADGGLVPISDRLALQVTGGENCSVAVLAVVEGRDRAFDFSGVAKLGALQTWLAAHLARLQ